MADPVLVRDDTTGKIFRCAVGECLVVGRKSPQSGHLDIEADNTRVSRRHCELRARPDGTLGIVDTSQYGVFVGGKRIEREGSAKPGERIVLGHDYALSVVLPDPSPVDATLARTVLDAPPRPNGDGAAAPLPADRLVGTTIKGRYRVMAKIAEGGMGAVFKAFDGQKKAACAIKLLLAGSQAPKPLVDRFKREADLGAKLGAGHPGIVAVIDAGTLEDSGELYCVMEYVDGRPLSNMIGPLLDRRQGIRIVAEVARAIAYAHSQGVVHRDLKPDNVLLTHEGRARLTDFGLAKVLEEEGGGLTATQTCMGTPNYVAPEQVQNARRAGQPADVYGLGGLLYSVLTGWPPFPGKHLATVLKNVTEGRLIPPRERDPSVAPELNAACIKALARDPSLRFPSAQAFAEELESWLKRSDGAPVVGRPAPGASGTVLLPSLGNMALPSGEKRLDTMSPVDPQFAGVEAVPALQEKLMTSPPLDARFVGGEIAPVQNVLSTSPPVDGRFAAAGPPQAPVVRDAPEVPPTAAASARIGPYEVRSATDAGGPCRAFVAIHTGSALSVLLRVMPREPDGVRALRQKSALLALEHPGIVRCLDIGEATFEGGPVVYVATAPVPGQRLSTQMDRPLRPERAALIAREIGRALGYAHARGVVHGDLRPENVLLEGNASTRIANFGGPEGTPADAPYTSPERGQGAPTTRSDLYSLGVLIFHLVTGQVPKLPTANGAPGPRFEQYKPELLVLRDDKLEALQGIVSRLVAKDPEQRPRTADEVVASLEAIWPDAEATSPTERRTPWLPLLALIAIGALLAAALIKFVGSPR